MYVGFLIGAPATFTWNLIKLKKRTIALVFPIVTFAIGMFIGPLLILFHMYAWRTQTIEYENKHNRFRKVEFQMKDIGSLGYNRRTVEVLYLTPLFIFVSEVPNDIDQNDDWIKVDRDVNELELKFP